MSEASGPAFPQLLLFTHTFKHRGSPQQETHISGAFTHPEQDNIVKRISQDSEHGATAIPLKTLASLNQMTCKFQIPGWS